MAYDANLVLATATTIATATTTSSTALSLRNPTSTTVVNPGGTPRRGLKARVRITAATGAAQTVSFQIAHSDDGTNFALLAAALPNNASVTAPSAAIVNTTAPPAIYIPFETDKPWIQLQAVSTGTGVSVDVMIRVD